MDEADLLGDRADIIAHEELMCYDYDYLGFTKPWRLSDHSL